MNRNNGRAISERLVILRDYLYANADKTHAVSMEDIQKEYFNAGFENEKGDYVSVKTVYEAIGNDLSVLFVLSDVCHLIHLSPSVSRRFSADLCAICALLDFSEKSKVPKKYEKVPISKQNRDFPWHAVRDSNP